ncbi:Cdc6/Cdc18 family protein [Haloprofundus halobius]|uniref:Cdc6/Cdc18 family protein n=1 Tax=Haloprofundus halobius TaxID=2876194 RepID=UPI001CC991BC|nr:orc1/cdc6 family replication initiation protein [Haloprofundus halobius]
MTDENLSEADRDSLFRYEEPIFAREELLDIRHIPGPERIVGRDTHMQRVANAVNPAIFGRPPKHLLIYGKTGTGKSLVSRHVTERLGAEAAKDDVTVRTAFVDCGEENTETSAVKTIASQLNESLETGISVPERGLATGDYYKRLWRILDARCDVALILLDEIDMLDDDEILRKLSRAGENNRVSRCSIGVIGISNKIDYPDQLTERVKSSFQHDEIVFKPYTADQLGDILDNRCDAFRPGVLGDDVIPLTSALAAQEHGDARKAIDILRNAGRIATEEESTEVVVDHVRKAKERTEANRFNEIVAGTPVQGKAILLALAMLTLVADETEFSTKRVYDTYTTIVSEIGMDQLSERRVNEILQEQAFLNVINSTRTSRGRGRGVYSTHRLLEDADIVRKVITADDRFDGFDGAGS